MDSWMVAVALLVGLFFVYRYFSPPFLHFRIAREQCVGKHVVVTGCDSGFGKLLAKRLFFDGYTVHACCLTQDGRERLMVSWPKIHTYRLDITDESQIQDFKLRILKQKVKLWALVNNAGIGPGSYVELTSLKTYRSAMDVNFFGYVAMTKACLPLIQRGGRIVNMTSAAGRACSAGLTAYASSKFATEAFSDGLRQELLPWGINVSVIEPGAMDTHIYKNIYLEEELGQDMIERYGLDFIESIKHRFKDLNLGNPQRVVNAYSHAIGSNKPHARYLVGFDARMVPFLSLLPVRLSDQLLTRSFGVNFVPTGVYLEKTCK